MKKMILSFIVSMLLSSNVLAQSDFVPIAPPPGGGTAGPGFNTCCAEGQSSGWSVSPTPVGALKGDTITIRYRMTWWNFARYNAQIWISNGINLRQIDSGTGLYGQWGWDGIGNFCFDCQFSFEAGEDYPQIGALYNGSPNFGLELTVVNVVSPPPVSNPARHPSQAVKNAAQSSANVAGTLTVAAGTTAVYLSATGFYNAAMVSYAISFGAYIMSAQFMRVANDPWTWEYASPYDWTADPEFYQHIQDFAWVCPNLIDPDPFIEWICPQLNSTYVYAQISLKGLAESLDRLESCNLINDPCKDWQWDYVRAYANGAADWLDYAAVLHQDYMQYYYYNIGNSPDDIAGWTGWYGQLMRDTAWYLRYELE